MRCESCESLQYLDEDFLEAMNSFFDQQKSPETWREKVRIAVDGKSAENFTFLLYRNVTDAVMIGDLPTELRMHLLVSVAVYAMMIHEYYRLLSEPKGGAL